MRSARPSASAVLPTPGSPISSGLFFRRRDEHLDHALELVGAADQRIDLALARALREVDAEALERVRDLLLVLAVVLTPRVRGAIGPPPVSTLPRRARCS